MYTEYPDFDGHALIASRDNPKIGFSAFIAIHSEARGPAMGGCRIVPYKTPAIAITDVLRLSRGMSYKNAIANIPYGGGKAVIIADPNCAHKKALLHEMGDFVRSLEGRYITSFDSGTTLDDVRTMGERTEFVAGTLAEAGNASLTTARGVYHCLRASAELRFGSTNLDGMKIAIQGVGNVGGRLARLLAADGAKLVIADRDQSAANAISEELGAEIETVDNILSRDVDILAPCALGAILNESSIPTIRAKVIVGGANNQLARQEDDIRLKKHEILYCPDYVANAGGIIDLHYQRSGWNAEAVETHVRTLADTFMEIAARAEQEGRGTGAVADAIASERIRHNGTKK